MAEERAHAAAVPVLDKVISSCCVTCSSPALDAEIRDNAASRARASGRPEWVGLILGANETIRGELDQLGKLHIEPIAQRNGWSLADAGMSAGQKNYVQVKDRHLFVLARASKSKFVVTRDGKILSGRGKLTPHECGSPDEFVSSN